MFKFIVSILIASCLLISNAQSQNITKEYIAVLEREFDEGVSSQKIAKLLDIASKNSNGEFRAELAASLLRVKKKVDANRFDVSGFDPLVARLQLVGKKMDIQGVYLNGASFDYKHYKGKVVVVDFWATWCRPCVSEFPRIRSLIRRHPGENFGVIGISLDSDINRLRSFVNSQSVNWHIVHNNGQGIHPTYKKYGLKGIPHYMLIGKDGKVIHTDLHGSELEKAVEEALK